VAQGGGEAAVSIRRRVDLPGLILESSRWAGGRGGWTWEGPHDRKIQGALSYSREYTGDSLNPKGYCPPHKHQFTPSPPAAAAAASAAAAYNAVRMAVEATH